MSKPAATQVSPDNVEATGGSDRLGGDIVRKARDIGQHLVRA